jgi:hypothetical protein
MLSSVHIAILESIAIYLVKQTTLVNVLQDITAVGELISINQLATTLELVESAPWVHTVL